MNEKDRHQLLVQEKQALETMRQTHPELALPVGAFSETDLLAHIGITSLPANRLRGYIRLRPEDFIVEEISQNGTVHTIDPYDAPLDDAGDHRTLFADLIKIGIPTHEAIERITATGIDPAAIGYGGLKDARAITSQEISFRGISHEHIQAAQIEAVLFRRLRYGSGILRRGDIKGNRFTLTIRTAAPLTDEEWQTRIDTIRAGVLNFYGSQRFGHRYLSHYLGRELVRGQYAEAIRMYLTSSNASEYGFLYEIRRQADEQYGDWTALKTLFQPWPITCQYELQIVAYLEQHPEDWIGALASIADQTKLWVYAYMSYLVNQLLSHLASLPTRPTEIPIPLSHRPNDVAPYASFLHADEVQLDFVNHLRPFPFLRPNTRFLPVLITPVIHQWKAIPEGLVLSFDLPTGAYATTVLMNMFEVETTHPTPGWVPTGQVDAPAILGVGSIEPLRDIWKKYFDFHSNLDSKTEE